MTRKRHTQKNLPAPAAQGIQTLVEQAWAFVHGHPQDWQEVGEEVLRAFLPQWTSPGGLWPSRWRQQIEREVVRRLLPQAEVRYSLRELAHMAHCGPRWLQIVCKQRGYGVFVGNTRMLAPEEAASLVEALAAERRRGPRRHEPDIAYYRRLQGLATTLRSGERVGGTLPAPTPEHIDYVVRGGQRIFVKPGEEKE